MKAGKLATRWWPFVVVLVVGLGGLAYWALTGDDPEGDALQACADEIEQKLAAPSTAVHTVRATEEGSRWRVEGYVESLDPSYEQVRLQYECLTGTFQGRRTTVAQPVDE